jgi:hypothetical protein
MILPSGFVKLVEDEFVKQVDAFHRLSNITSATWHQEMLFEFKRDWLTLRSDNTCFVCMMARSQYGLPCGHIICDICVRRFGIKSDMWTFDVPHCFLCGSETLGVNVKVKPPTATTRLLCIDGGGVRGIIPLVILQALEERIGLEYPVQGNFHLVFGTSSGEPSHKVDNCLILIHSSCRWNYHPCFRS